MKLKLLLILREPWTSNGSELFPSFIMLWHHKICIAKVLYSYRDALPKRLFKITAGVCIKPTSGWRVKTDSALILPSSLHWYFPASRGLSRRGKNERKERVSLLSLIFASSWETSASREHQCSVIQVFKATSVKLHGKERSRNKDLSSHLEIGLGTFRIERAVH